jgi:ankyrin repeat protein
MFLDAGASIEMSLQRGKPLHHAAERAKDAQLIELLLRRGARVGEPNSLGRFALTEAICNGNLEGAKALMDAGEDLYVEPTNGISKQDLEMSAFLDQAEKEGKKTVSADFIKMQRTRIENNRARAPFFYLQFVKEPRFKKAVIEHARKLGQAER